jgi:RNA polymerase sigma factor (sigma-70 family)
MMSSESKPGEDELYKRLLEVLEPLARRAMARERRSPTLCTSDLVNEAARRLFQSSRDHLTIPKLKALGGRVIRQVLAERGRKKHFDKRIPPALIHSLDENPEEGRRLEDPASQAGLGVDSDLDWVRGLEKVLRRTEEELGEEAALIAEHRLYAGMTDEEIAEVLGVSARTVQRKRRLVRDFWSKEFGGADDQG